MQSLSCGDALYASTSGAHINVDGMPYVGRDTMVSDRWAAPPKSFRCRQQFRLVHALPSEQVSQSNILNLELRSSFRQNAEGRFRCYVSATADQQWTVRAKPTTASPYVEAGQAVSLGTSPDNCTCGWRQDVSVSPVLVAVSSRAG